MIHDVKEFFGIKREFNNAGFFETDNYKMICQDVISAAKEGRVLTITGIVGSGKTVTMRKIKEDLRKKNEVLVSTNLTVDKHRVNLGTLIFVLFSDLIIDKTDKIPSKLELRERELINLIKRRRKPVALFIDEAHDLHGNTLKGLKRLQEITQEGNALLSIILIGHPKLSIELKKPQMEEIGGRVFNLEMKGIQGIERDYVLWLLKQCLDPKATPTDVFTNDSIDFMAEKLISPLQINYYVWNALVKAYEIGEKPIDVNILQEIISTDLNSIEAKLKRHGYGLKALCEFVDARPAEIRSFFKNRLTPTRTKEISDELLKLGITGS